MLKSIIATHFGGPCEDLSLLSEGAYAHVYVTTLKNGPKLAVHVVLPVRDSVKTEAEVATMDSVRGMCNLPQSQIPYTDLSAVHTSIPVPKVHLFCSTRYNPVGAEWMVMD